MNGCKLMASKEEKVTQFVRLAAKEIVIHDFVLWVRQHIILL